MKQTERQTADRMTPEQEPEYNQHTARMTSERQQRNNRPTGACAPGQTIYRPQSGRLATAAAAQTNRDLMAKLTSSALSW